MIKEGSFEGLKTFCNLSQDESSQPQERAVWILKIARNSVMCIQLINNNNKYI